MHVDLKFIYLQRVRSATVNGTTYKKKNIMVCAIEDEEPVFCEIVDIVETPIFETLFVVRNLVTLYEVVPTSSIVVYHHSQFCDYHPLHICRSYSTNRSLLVCLKYHILCK